MATKMRFRRPNCFERYTLRHSAKPARPADLIFFSSPPPRAICTSASDLPTYARSPRLRKLNGGASPLELSSKLLS
eukprot:5888412-Prymnesium_polylepis.1